jgi:hypothetical protein
VTKVQSAHSKQLVLLLCWCLASAPTLYNSLGDYVLIKCSLIPSPSAEPITSHGILPHECSLPITPWHPHNWCPAINPPKLTFLPPCFLHPALWRTMACYRLVSRQTLLTGSINVQDIMAMVRRHGWHS